MVTDVAAVIAGRWFIRLVARPTRLCAILMLASLGVVGAPEAAMGQMPEVASALSGGAASVVLPAAKADPGPEIARLRTRTSQTFAAEAGSYETRVSRESVNYRDGAGRWQPIDNTLRADGTVLRNGANRYQLSIPRALSSGCGACWQWRCMDRVHTARCSR
jgi:hypothetical protein